MFVLVSPLDCGFLFLSCVCQDYASIIKSFGELLCSLKHFIWHKYLSLGFVWLYLCNDTGLALLQGISLTTFYCFVAIDLFSFIFFSLINFFFFLESKLRLCVFKIVRTKWCLVFSYNLKNFGMFLCLLLIEFYYLPACLSLIDLSWV